MFINVNKSYILQGKITNIRLITNDKNNT